jgi:phage terminase large subunit
VSQATCLWCRSALVLADVLGLKAWVCPQQPCRMRQLACAQVSGVGKTRTCHFLPLPSQVPLWEVGVRKLLWGGQAGPGKSTGARRWLYDRSLRVEGHEALILRENWEQLDKTHLRKMEREVEALGGRFFKSDRKVEFGKGSAASIIDCGHMADMEAVSRYLSTEYHAIVPDEASLYPVDTDGTTPLAELSTRARKVGTDRETGASVPPRFLPVTNPGGPSAPWLREMFIDHTPDFDKYPALKGKYDPADWVYLPAALDDNPYLDPEYETSLAVLNKVRYEQLRHGDWTVFSGQFFSEWSPRTHVRELTIPPGTDVFCSMDWGYNAPGVLLWWACLPDGHYHLFRELKFQQDTAETVGRTWHAINRELGVQPRSVVADPSMWAKTGAGRGEAIAETLQRLRVPMRRGDNDRVNGWQRCHELLRLDAFGVPWLTVSGRCAYLVRSLPAQMSDRLHPDDVDTKGDDHAVDALRYGAMSRPSPTRLLTQAKKLHPWLEEAIAGSTSRTVLGSANVRRTHVS